MDETTKVIIATLSGFIIAFLAEPVKNYIQNRSKLYHLKVALYSELIHNSRMLTGYSLYVPEEGRAKVGQYMALRTLRVECYENALKNELTLFYQLPEALPIIMLQGTMISGMIHMQEDVKRVFEDSSLDDAYEMFQFMNEQFQTYLSAFTYNGTLDSELMKKLASKTYKRLIESGKEAEETISKWQDEAEVKSKPKSDFV